MGRESNFLLGRGEKLTTRVDVPKGGGPKKTPYTFAQAKDRIEKQLVSITREIVKVPLEACPKNEVVAVVTMHPRYISKSDFPEDLLKSVGLRSVGSKPSSIQPEKWGTTKHPKGNVVTEQLFVAGTKESFNRWAKSISGWNEKNKGAAEITHIEDVSFFKTKDKIKSLPTTREESVFEAVLHNSGNDKIIQAFEAFAKKIGSKPLMTRKKDIKGLTFIPLRATSDHAKELAQFSFLRAIRGMPELRPIDQDIIRSISTSVILPTANVLDSSFKAVIFDGGMPANNHLRKWVTHIEPKGIGPSHPSLVAHGVGVTSAMLFGHIDSTKLEVPFCNVDHVRVLDSNPTDLQLLDVLDRITSHLDQNENKYHFANLSLGPRLAVTDDEVNVWTASLDERLSKNDILTSVAVGNDGGLDESLGLNRVQPPSDGVNILSVGACDIRNFKWKRATYSCVGPGRRPGIVKPDGVAFGGSEEEPFVLLTADQNFTTRETRGTSFASPLALRAALGVKAYLGKDILPRTIKALMIHRADPKKHSKKDVGWGRFEESPNQLITSEDDEVFVIYQGELPVGGHLRAPIPLPTSGLTGRIFISATLNITPEIDPEHPGAYTRSGLEVTFRPHSKKYKNPNGGKVAAHPQSKSFFSVKNMYGKAEYEFREDGYKWEPCLKNTKPFLSKSLHEPCFDIYYHHRFAGNAAVHPRPIAYSLIVSVKAPKVPDFYNKVVRAYNSILIPLKPKVQIQVKV